jgi:dipeptidyl aminopeptidase/acylaminoacyl peptidase
VGLLAGVAVVLHASTTVAQAPLLSGEIAYVQNGDIRLLDLATGQSRQLTTDGNNASPAWAPDGQRLAFVGDQNVTAGDIYTVNPDGTGRTRVTNTPQEQKTYVTYAPDGALLYVRLVESDIPQDRNYRNAIVRREPSGAETVLHTTELARCDIMSLDYAPDGRLTIGTYCIAGRNVILRDLQTGTDTDLAAMYPSPDTGCSYYAAWAGQLLAVLTKMGCQVTEPSTLHLLDFSTGSTPQLAWGMYGAPDIGSVSWNPSGQQLVFDQSDQNSTSQGLWVWSGVDPPVQVAQSGMRPAWRPTGAAAPTATAPTTIATPTTVAPDATETPAPIPSATPTVAPAVTETPTIATPTPPAPDATVTPAPAATATPPASGPPGGGSFLDQWSLVLGMAGGLALLAIITAVFILRRPPTMRIEK